VDRGLDGDASIAQFGSSPLRHRLVENHAFEGLAKGLAAAHELIAIPK
jgi:hypothetical protein